MPFQLQYRISTLVFIIRYMLVFAPAFRSPVATVFRDGTGQAQHRLQTAAG